MLISIQEALFGESEVHLLLVDVPIADRCSVLTRLFLGAPFFMIFAQTPINISNDEPTKK